MASPTKQDLVTQFTTVQAGIDKHLTAPVTLGGISYDAAALKQPFAASVAAILAAEALQKQWFDAVAAASAAEARALALLELLRNLLLASYGKQANAVLNDFGIAVPKARGPQTVEAKAAAAEKRKLTRAARHTMGSQQKKLVKGTVEVPVTSLPVATAPAPEPAPATAPTVATPPAKPGA